MTLFVNYARPTLMEKVIPNGPGNCYSFRPRTLVDD